MAAYDGWADTPQNSLLARITELETALTEAEGRVIADVVAWLRNEAGDPDDFATYAATALETGEWKK